MSDYRKADLLRYDQRVIKAADIGATVLPHHPALSEIVARIRHLARDPLTLVVMGEFSAGKSSFLNRLLDTDALPVAILPKTATLTRLVHGEPDAVATVEIDREGETGIDTTTISLHEFAQLQRAARLHDIAVVQDLARIREARVFLNDPLLRKLQLVDTPGFNHDAAMDSRTLGILDRADLVVWITDAVQPAKQTEFDKLRLLKERGKRLWLIVNKADVNVADAAAWEESRKSLEEYFRDIGFLDFFESRRFDLVSCRETDDFWNQQFEHTKARLGTDIFNLDMIWSSKLVGDEWERLGKALDEEATRHRELEHLSATLRQLLDLTAVSQDCLNDLNEATEPQLRGLSASLSHHGNQCRKAAELETPSLTAFAMEYTREPLVSALTALTQVYDKWFLQWYTGYLKRFIALLDTLHGILGQEHESLRTEAMTLRDYHHVLRERLCRDSKRPDGASLPAVEGIVELLDHLVVQFSSINWRFLQGSEVEQVLQPDESPTSLGLDHYCRTQLRAALKRDALAELQRHTHEPISLSLLGQLTDLCDGSGERLSMARSIWRGHNATSLDDD